MVRVGKTICHIDNCANKVCREARVCQQAMTPDTEKRLYGGRDARELGEYYTRHVYHMTSEGLHSKADIAKELAYRDRLIDDLRAENDSLLERLREECNHVYVILDVDGHKSTSPCQKCGRKIG